METFSPNYLASAFEIDRATAVRLLKGVEPTAKAKGRETYSIAAFAAALDAHRAKNNSNANDGTDSPSASAALTAARTRIAIANADAKELANSVSSGRFLDGFAIVEDLTPLFSTIKEIALSTPGKTADEIASHCAEEIQRVLAGTRFDPVRLRSAVFEIINLEIRAMLTTMSTPEAFLAAYVAANPTKYSREAFYAATGTADEGAAVEMEDSPDADVH